MGTLLKNSNRYIICYYIIIYKLCNIQHTYKDVRIILIIAGIVGLLLLAHSIADII